MTEKEPSAGPRKWQERQRFLQNEVLGGGQTQLDIFDKLVEEFEEVEEHFWDSTPWGEFSQEKKDALMEEYADIIIVALGAIDFYGGDAEQIIQDKMDRTVEKYKDIKSLLEQGHDLVAAQQIVKTLYERKGPSPTR